MEKIERERQAILEHQAQRIERGKTNPDILLTPRAMSRKLIKKVDDLYKLYLEAVVSDVDDNAEIEIVDAMRRTEELNIHAYEENFAQRLIKLNQIDYKTWRTGDVQKIYDREMH